VLHCVVVVAVDEASSVGTIEGAAAGSMRTVRALVAGRPALSAATLIEKRSGKRSRPMT